MNSLQTLAYREIAFSGVCSYVAMLGPTYISEGLFEHLFKYIDYNAIHDRKILRSEWLLKNLWRSNLSKRRMINLMIKNPNVMNHIDIGLYDFDIKELIPLFMIHGYLIECFDIDYTSMTFRQALQLLSCNQSLLNKLDFKTYDYDQKDMVWAIRKYPQHSFLLDLLDLKLLDHYTTRKLLRVHGEKHIKGLPLEKLKASDWLSILKNRPELLKYCDFSLFEGGDCFLLIKLVELFPVDLSCMIEENKDKISGLGWEKLIKMNHELYLPLADLDKLTSKHWNSIIAEHPHLRGYAFN